MTEKSDLYATVDALGRLIMPESVAVRYGLIPGERLSITPGSHSVRLRQSVSCLTKVYIEPTSQCNLMCTTCIRNTWDEQPGLMSDETFGRIINGIRAFSPRPLVFFGGLGEPLSHPDIITMLNETKKVASQVELITNGTLLTDAVAGDLIDAGLDVLWVSVDGARPESYADVRLGAALPDVVQNLSRFRDARKGLTPHIGIVFVAMKRNIAELPEVIHLGKRLGADRFLVTNVLPYTEQMCSQVLYADVLGNSSVGVPSPLAPLLNFSKMDICEETITPLHRVIRGWRIVNFVRDDAEHPVNSCPFIETGSTAISWNGSVCPCLPLMHNHVSFLDNRRRTTRRCAMGNITTATLKDIWSAPEYVALRERVRTFDFSPCTVCGGCRLSQANEEDCLGNEFPTCGGCLWAQGVIQCP